MIFKNVSFHILQITAETAYDMVSPGPSVKAKNRRRGKRKINRPQDIREGVTNAYYIVKEVIIYIIYFFLIIKFHQKFKKNIY